MSNNTLEKKVKSLPETPGVYFFYDNKKRLIYVGKATSLKNRVRSYFIGAHDNKTERLVSEVVDLKFKSTPTVLEALILESNLIKKNQPKYNIKAKDDKSFSYFLITKNDEFPRIIIARETDLKMFPEAKNYGPYTSRRQMELALRIIRKIFPFHSRKEKTEKGCLDFQLGLCPGPYLGKISRKDYLKNISQIELILRGKKASLIKKLEREMASLSHAKKYEEAAALRDRIFALKHIRDTALISKEEFVWPTEKSAFTFKKIEGYDISNLGGQFAVGSLVSFFGDRPNKKSYRHFKIKNVSGINDFDMMREVISRRLKREDWPKPDLIILDGGLGHLNTILELLEKKKERIPVLAVSKGPRRNKLDFHSREKKILENKAELEPIAEKVRNEAHRFAINYHKKLRGREWLKQDED